MCGGGGGGHAWCGARALPPTHPPAPSPPHPAHPLRGSDPQQQQLLTSAYPDTLLRLLGCASGQAPPPSPSSDAAEGSGPSGGGASGGGGWADALCALLTALGDLAGMQSDYKGGWVGELGGRVG